MKIIQPYYVLETPLTPEFRDSVLSVIERSARTCYKSEGACQPGSASPFVRKIAQVLKHASVIEHACATVRFVCDRGVTHELVRHRLASFSQESTRYCNYSGDKFGNEITVIATPFWENTDARYHQWYKACKDAEDAYLALLSSGASPQEARSVLPNSLKTEIVMTANLREWRHVFTLRAAKEAHPQMRQLMRPLLAEFKLWMPELFDDIHPEIPPTETQKPCK
jgi:thymidylate synthase (FAD)